MKPAYLVRGLPGHPLHPPLTDVTVGAYTFATVAAFCDVVGISNNAATHAWWLALFFGLISTVVTALAGFLDWLQISWGTPLWRTATTHAIANLLAGGLFLVALLIGHDDFKHGDVTTGPFVVTLAGFAMLLLGGWLGGAIVFVHGMRVLNLPDEPALRAAAPVPTPEKEQAAGG
jgi:uncharacterized membrane protein